MKPIRPWSDEAERILNRLVKVGKAYTTNSQFTRMFGRKYPELFDKHNGFMDIAPIKKRSMSVILPRDDVIVYPIPGKPSDMLRLRHKKKYGFVRK